LIAGLDAARALAALYVVVHHVTNSMHLTSKAAIVFRFGQEAVIVFFLLSGFVIFANEQHRAADLKGYTLRRFKRIYPPIIFAMIVSTLVALYNGDLAEQFRGSELILTLLSVQDSSGLKPGVISDPYLGNAPLWSLSYEVAFYAMFPVALRIWLARPTPAAHAFGAISCIAYVLYALFPNHWCLVLAYFSLWWAGAAAAAAYLQGGRTIRSLAIPLFWLTALTAIAVVVALILGPHRIGFYPLLPARHFGFAALLLLVCFGPIGGRLARLCARRARVFAAIASISYGLYVLHFPVMVQWTVARSSAAGLAAATVLTVLLAYAVDRRGLWLFARRKLPAAGLQPPAPSR
jgi:peptidoglycan/LPS O-acetylase OafA/YrhL